MRIGLAHERGLGVPVSALGEQLWRAANAALGERLRARRRALETGGWCQTRRVYSA
jgi:hypothetical protein